MQEAGSDPGWSPNGRELGYDRRVAGQFLAEFGPGGRLDSVAEFVHRDRAFRDLHLRRPPFTALSVGPFELTVYAGMSGVLTIRCARDRWSARTHRAHAALDSWNEVWRLSCPIGQFVTYVPGLLLFLEAVTRRVEGQSRHNKEGRVHAGSADAVDHGRTLVPSLRIVDREASVGFSSGPCRDSWIASFHSRVSASLSQVDAGEQWSPHLPPGTGCDFWCTDGHALYAVEAKAAGSGKGIGNGPLQVRQYAELAADWIASHSAHTEVLSGMINQRSRLGFGAPAPLMADRPPVVPVLLVGPGKVSAEWERRARMAAKLIEPVTSPGVTALQWWRLDSDGRVSEWM